MVFPAVTMWLRTSVYINYCREAKMGAALSADRKAISMQRRSEAAHTADESPEEEFDAVDSQNITLRGSLVGLTDLGRILMTTVKNYDQTGMEAWVSIALFLILIAV